MPIPFSAPWIAPTVENPCLPLFRRSFTLDKPLAQATLRICALGHFELRVNGHKIGDDLLEPAWSDYRKTCYCVTRDMTPHLRAGENVIAVMLGNGMYNVTGGRYSKFKASFGPLKLTASLKLDFTDNTSTELTTDATWKSHHGPITFSCIYGGEDHDARLEPLAWDAPGFDDSAWTLAILTDSPGGQLLPQISPPVRVIERFNPISITEPEPGTFVYDLGQNFSGRPAIKIRGAAGDSIKLKTGELLDSTGLVTQKNTGSPVHFTYTLHGDVEPESWSPRFSYTGFRYVQVTGVKPLELTGEFISSSARQVGHFECSNDLFNRIHRLILAAIRSNFQHVLTDCPHREKLGWLEQTYLMGDAIFYNFAAGDFYTKICRDMRDAQHDNGCVPTIAPQYTSFKAPWDIFNDSPEWGSAIVQCPWLAYRYTGNQKILQENYDAMKCYIAYLHSRETPATKAHGSAVGSGLIDYGLGDWYDIGPGDPGFSKLTSKAFTATAIYFLDLTVMSRVAAVLGLREDEKNFAMEAWRIQVAFNAKLFDAATRVYDRGSQCACAMPLALGLVEEKYRGTILQELITDIRILSNHITAGDIGFRFVLIALAQAGRSDVIFDLLTRTDPPSYGAQLARGATALAEAWDANPNKSQNHLMLGHAEAWFYETLAGIQIDLSRPPPHQITLAPTPVGDITWVSARHESPLGGVWVHWERSQDKIDYEIEVPTDATFDPPSDPGSSRLLSPGKHKFSLKFKTSDAQK
jgi:alpha-L-rhamnosidase